MGVGVGVGVGVVCRCIRNVRIIGIPTGVVTANSVVVFGRSVKSSVGVALNICSDGSYCVKVVPFVDYFEF